MSDLVDHNKALRDNWSSVVGLKEALYFGHIYDAIMFWDEIEEKDQRSLWVAPTKGGILTTKERGLIKSSEWGEIRRLEND